MRLYKRIFIAFAVTAALAGCTSGTVGSRLTPYASVERHVRDSGGGIPGKTSPALIATPTPAP